MEGASGRSDGANRNANSPTAVVHGNGERVTSRSNLPDNSKSLHNSETVLVYVHPKAGILRAGGRVKLVRSTSSSIETQSLMFSIRNLLKSDVKFSC
jgi:hypothetical protein